ncbi:SWPV1-133 [Shearwaterpox virus]|uniref:SWPV1-133 n=1 Tax=Shearwaterpox virus TaxID=1974596 RepID=A0A1V0S7W9_CNPV|nr:SWPV1-133 [Shearwaterpox virus]
MLNEYDKSIPEDKRMYIPFNNRYSLYNAIKAKKINIVKRLLDMGCDVNAKDERTGYFPIHLLAQQNQSLKNYRHDILIAKILLEKGADIEAKDKEGYTVLFNAAKIGKTHLVKFLLSSGASIKSNTKYNLLMCAILSGKISTVRYIINYNKELLDIDSSITALQNGDYKMTQFLIDSGLDINKKSSLGKTILHHAIEYRYNNKNVNLVKMLINNNADVNIKDKQSKTPLHIVTDYYDCMYRNYPSKNIFNIAKMLINKGAEVNALDYNNATPLHNAVKSTIMIETVKLLINHGADINAVDDYGITPLNYACTSPNYIHYMTNDILREKLISKEEDNDNNNLDINCVIDILIKNGADINFIDKYGRTCLHYASVSSHVKIVELVLNYCNKLSVTDNKGNSPLHYASSNFSCKDIVYYLINKGINPNIRNLLGKTPLFYAIHIPEIVNILLNNYAIINIADYKNKTILETIDIDTFHDNKLYLNSLEYIVKIIVLEGYNNKDSCYFRNVEVLDKFDSIKHLKILCEQELEIMKTLKINSEYTVYDIINIDDYNLTINTYIKDIDLSKFPQYSSYIMKSIKKINYRHELLKKFLTYIDNLFIYNNYWNLLPSEIKYKIVSNINNKNLETILYTISNN